MENSMKALQVSMIAGVLSGLWFLYDHHHGRLAFAASGGRMGGSDFSSTSSRSSSDSYKSSSSSYSYPSSYYSSGCSRSSIPNYRPQIGSPGPKKFKPIRFIITCSAIVLGVYLLVKMCEDDLDAAKTSVIKLQVGSLGEVRQLQKELNRIAKVADTSNSKGLQYVLQELMLALLRHSEYCISGYSSMNVKRSVEGCEKQFNQLCIKERVKFDEETLVYVNNIKKKSATSQNSNRGLRNEYIVVTIIVAARGVLELPPVKSTEQLKEALQKLASIPSSKIMAVEVLWTPQKEDDWLTEQEMLEDYPLLNPL